MSVQLRVLFNSLENRREVNTFWTGSVHTSKRAFLHGVYVIIMARVMHPSVITPIFQVNIASVRCASTNSVRISFIRLIRNRIRTRFPQLGKPLQAYGLVIRLLPCMRLFADLLVEYNQFGFCVSVLGKPTKVSAVLYWLSRYRFFMFYAG